MHIYISIELILLCFKIICACKEVNFNCDLYYDINFYPVVHTVKSMVHKLQIPSEACII